MSPILFILYKCRFYDKLCNIILLKPYSPLKIKAFIFKYYLLIKFLQSRSSFKTFIKISAVATLVAIGILCMSQSLTNEFTSGSNSCDEKDHVKYYKINFIACYSCSYLLSSTHWSGKNLLTFRR